MQQLPNFGDERTLAFCAFCGGQTATRDHCPSKVFLDEPYPENLPVVPACRTCNSGFSIDEEYLACLISCVLAGSTEPDALQRDKIKRILRSKLALKALLEQARSESNGRTTYAPDHKRVSSVLIKLAQGHALYEMHESCAREPDQFQYVPLELMTPDQLDSFESPEISSAWPEVGSRAMQRLLITGSDVLPSGWIEVQSGRYRFLASLGNGVEIRIVIHEYLAVFARWE
jgi:hypothetical protein